MPWDRRRPVPWKRLLMFEALYVALFVGFILVVQPDNLRSALGSIAFAIVLTTGVLYALVKFGYQPNWLRSREELAAIRAEKDAARRAAQAAKQAEKSGKPVPTGPVRDKPAPTKRTSTGATNRPRRTRDTRKR